MKKLASILALTAIVANLGLATALAAGTPATGSQAITCGGGGLSFQSIPPKLQFTGKTVVFASGTTDAYVSAALASNGDPYVPGAVLDVQDTRGYDPADNTDASTGGTTGMCAAGLTVAEQSTNTDGSHGMEFTADSHTFVIPLWTGAIDDSALTAEDTTVAHSSPDAIRGTVAGGGTDNIVNVTTDSASTAISSDIQLIKSVESFYGDFTLNLNTLNHQVLVARHDYIEKGDVANGLYTATVPIYTGPIPAGTYTGTITFTLA
jgi:hypothetical protein